MEVHDAFALEDGDLCVFLIDNANGVAPEVQEQVDFVKKYGIKAVYYFCDERSLEQTVLEKSLTGVEFIKTVHKFGEVSQKGANALIGDIVSVYREYCKGKGFVSSPRLNWKRGVRLLRSMGNIFLESAVRSFPGLKFRII